MEIFLSSGGNSQQKNYIRKPVRHTKCLVDLLFYGYSLPSVLASQPRSSGKHWLHTQSCKNRTQFEAKRPQNQTGLEMLERAPPTQPTPVQTTMSPRQKFGSIFSPNLCYQMEHLTSQSQTSVLRLILTLHFPLGQWVNI